MPLPKLAFISGLYPFILFVVTSILLQSLSQVNTSITSQALEKIKAIGHNVKRNPIGTVDTNRICFSHYAFGVMR